METHIILLPLKVWPEGQLYWCAYIKVWKYYSLLLLNFMFYFPGILSITFLFNLRLGYLYFVHRASQLGVLERALNI